MEMLVVTRATALRIPTARFTRSCRLLSPASNFSVLCKQTTRNNSLTKIGIRASARKLIGPVKVAKSQQHHPSEDTLTPVEICRTIVKTNSKALIMFSGVAHVGFYENLLMPDVSYVMGEHGNIYFHVKDPVDQILTTFASGDNLMQVIIGLDTTKLVSTLEGDRGSVSETLKPLCSSLPMDFNKQLANFASDDRVNYIHQPSRVFIQGVLRHAFVEYSSKEELEKDQNGTSYYKLEMIKMQLIETYGDQALVKVKYFMAHSTGKIISGEDKMTHLGKIISGGDKMTHSFKSLCWRCNGIELEEVPLIGVDATPKLKYIREVKTI